MEKVNFKVGDIVSHNSCDYVVFKILKNNRLGIVYSNHEFKKKYMKVVHENQCTLRK